MVEGYGHHTYLEQEHLPIVSSGPVYPAPSPDGKSLAFAHQGWIWVLDFETGVARRVTKGGIDGRPRWSPEGLAFVRDFGADTAVVVKQISDSTNRHRHSRHRAGPGVFARRAMVVLSSAREGQLAIWRRSRIDGSDTKVSEGTRARRSSRSLADGRLVFQSEDGAARGFASSILTEMASRSCFSRDGWRISIQMCIRPVS